MDNADALPYRKKKERSDVGRERRWAAASGGLVGVVGGLVGLPPRASWFFFVEREKMEK